MDSGKDTPDAKKVSSSDAPSSSNVLEDIPIVSMKQDDADYPMDHPNGRKALIFSHYTYDQNLGLENRNGTDVDVKALRNVLPKLGFHDHKVFHDLKLSEIEREIELVTGDNHVNTDCFAIFVLTHGECEEDKRDGGKRGNLAVKLYAYDRLYPITYLWEEFAGKKGTKLTGKPKLFFIQACQGDQRDPGQKVQYQKRTAFDSGSPFIMYKLPTQADFFIAMATVPCYPARRNETIGSWFIHELCEVFSEYHEDMELKPMLTIVSRQVGKREANCKKSVDHQMMQAPMTVSTLLRNLYFKTLQNS